MQFPLKLNGVDLKNEVNHMNNNRYRETTKNKSESGREKTIISIQTYRTIFFPKEVNKYSIGTSYKKRVLSPTPTHVITCRYQRVIVRCQCFIVYI